VSIRAPLYHFCVMNRRLLSILLGLGLGVLITLMLLRGPNGQMPGLSLDEAEEYTPWPAPDPSFLSLAGDTLRVSQFRGTHVALFFGYTWCPDVCPITLAQLGKAATELDPDGDKLRLLFVSLDPYRDTPERLATWTQAFHADVVSLTGDLELLRAAAWDWGIDFRYRTLPTPGEVVDVPPSDAGYLVDHTARTFLIDPEGRVIAQVAPETDGATLQRLLERIL
jgi:protein SCO1/2